MAWVRRTVLATLAVVTVWTVFYHLTQHMWSSSSRPASQTSAVSGHDDRPNFIFVLTDDQDVSLGGMDHMKQTNSFFIKHGVIFQNAFTVVPVCCPSRASILSGRYQHHHQVINNSLSGNCYGPRWRQEDERRTFAVHLQRANYTTFFAGKYLNQYGIPADREAQFVPPGWNHWNGLVGNSVYYNYNLSVNGKVEPHLDQPEDYLTDLINKRAADFLRNYNPNADNPFFMMLSTPACHSPFTPSTKYDRAFVDAQAPRTPNFNVSAGEYKHWLLRQAPAHLSDDVVSQIDKNCGKRWATLLSVDDMVAEIIQILNDKRILDNTYIIFASDNGFHLGQFSLPWDKRQMYDFDLRIPLMVYGPGVTAGVNKTEPVVSIDLAPTFLEMAGVRVPSDMDGRSLVPLLLPTRRDQNAKRRFQWRTKFLVEYHGEGIAGPVPGCPQYGDHAGVSNCFPDCVCEDAFNNTYSCLRTLTDLENSVFCVFDDSESFVEAYDLKDDPYQLDNIAPLMSESKQLRYRKYLRSFQG